MVPFNIPYNSTLAFFYIMNKSLNIFKGYVDLYQDNMVSGPAGLTIKKKM